MIKEQECTGSEVYLTIFQIKLNMQNVLKKIYKERIFNKEIINQLVNKIEIDRETNVVIYFNFQKPKSIGV